MNPIRPGTQTIRMPESGLKFHSASDYKFELEDEGTGFGVVIKRRNDAAYFIFNPESNFALTFAFGSEKDAPLRIVRDGDILQAPENIAFQTRYDTGKRRLALNTGGNLSILDLELPTNEEVEKSPYLQLCRAYLATVELLVSPLVGAGGDPDLLKIEGYRNLCETYHGRSLSTVDLGEFFELCAFAIPHFPRFSETTIKRVLLSLNEKAVSNPERDPLGIAQAIINDFGDSRVTNSLKNLFEGETKGSMMALFWWGAEPGTELVKNFKKNSRDIGETNNTSFEHPVLADLLARAINVRYPKHLASW